MKKKIKLFEDIVRNPYKYAVGFFICVLFLNALFTITACSRKVELSKPSECLAKYDSNSSSQGDAYMTLFNSVNCYGYEQLGDGRWVVHCCGDKGAVYK